jgi:hypothetical protein
MGKKGRSQPLHEPSVEEAAENLKLRDDVDDDVAGRVFDKEFVHDQMMSTVPSQRFRQTAPSLVRTFWFWENSGELHRHKTQINFTKIASQNIAALDSAGTPLPILISTMFDFIGIGQAEMWKKWFIREEFHMHYVRSRMDTRIPDGFSGPLCSHFIVKSLGTEAGAKPFYKCLWCEVSDVLPPYHYAFMQELDRGDYHFTDKQHTGYLTRYWSVPTADVPDWQISPVNTDGASTSS